MHEYDTENYASPWLPYKILSDKQKIGHLIFDSKLQKVTKVDIEILISNICGF